MMVMLPLRINSLLPGPTPTPTNLKKKGAHVHMAPGHPEPS